jgi:hypothetical protein
VSWNAYKQFEAKYGQEDEFIEGFTNDQLFFVSFAQLWCIKKDMINPNDPHSPPKARVLGVLRNSQAFANAFHCPVNSSMNPSNKCSIWESKSSHAFSFNFNLFDISAENQAKFSQTIALILSLMILIFMRK